GWTDYMTLKGKEPQEARRTRNRIEPSPTGRGTPRSGWVRANDETFRNPALTRPSATLSPRERALPKKIFSKKQEFTSLYYRELVLVLLALLVVPFPYYCPRWRLMNRTRLETDSCGSSLASNTNSRLESPGTTTCVPRIVSI